MVIAGVLVTAQATTTKSLRIYVVDVEGGNATLFVAPSGGSVLVDTGNPGAAAARDAARIMAAVKDAGLSQIDHLITTHWHGDHFGAMSELATRIPIRHFIDHGPTIQPQALSTEFLNTQYPALYGRSKHTVVQPGDRIPVDGLDWRIVASAGKVMKTPLGGGGGTNPYCSGFKPQEADTGENAQSVGSVITFGNFRAMHLGDLTWNKEFELMCPNNTIGTIDLNIVSHHGQPSSNAEVLVHAVRARVGILNNGTRKGGQPAAMKILYSAPGLEHVWQLHFSELSGQEVHDAWVVHRQRCGRSAFVDADRRFDSCCARWRRATTACAQRPGILDQGVSHARWVVHCHKCSQRIQQVVRGPMSRDYAGLRSNE